MKTKNRKCVQTILLHDIGVGRGGGGGGGGHGGQAPPIILEGGANIPFGPPIIHPPFPSISI